MTAAGRRRGRRTVRIAVVAGVVAAVTAATATALGFNPALTGEDTGGATTNVPAATAAVTRETLVDSRSETGELGYGTAESLACKLGGTLTAIADPGGTVKRGKTLYQVDDLPIVLMYGTVPAYRDLSPGLTGDDVEQLEANLAELGYGGFTEDDAYSDTTATAVRAWQADLGMPETGVVELGRVVFAPGAMRVETQEAAVGDAAQPGASVLTYTGTAKVVTVELDVDDAERVAEGDKVSVRLPGGETEGEIGDELTFIETGQDTEPTTKVRVTITIADEDALEGLDQASVKVEFTASQRENVLTVPVAALLALAGGGYGVEVVEGSATRIVPVETGLFAGGRVEVSGEGLGEGMLVGVPA